MGFEVFRKRDDVCRALYQRQRKKICSIPRAYNVLENIRLVYLVVKIVLNFSYCMFLFSFSMKRFPFLLLNSCEDYSSGSDTVTTGKGNVWWNCWESVMCIIIYTFNRYTVQANGSLPHIPVASRLSTWTVPADGRVFHCEQLYPKKIFNCVSQ